MGFILHGGGPPGCATAGTKKLAAGRWPDQRPKLQIGLQKSKRQHAAFASVRCTIARHHGRLSAAG